MLSNPILAGKYSQVLAASPGATEVAFGYQRPMYSYGQLEDIENYRRLQRPAGPSFDPSDLVVPSRLQPGDPGYDPFLIEDLRDNFIKYNPRSGVAQLPGNEQGPSQGPATPIRYYEGMGYGPAGPEGGGIPPTPLPLELAGSFNMPIDPNAHRQQNKKQKLYNKGVSTDNPYEKEIFLRRTGVQLPKV